MKYYYIYSAGGGAGDWNGVKRIWAQKMPLELKKSVLIKFGDIYFNHASNKEPIKKRMWDNVQDARAWLADAVDDVDVLNDTDIILDNGTSKLINSISHSETKNPLEIIEQFNNIIEKYKILDKYAAVIKESKINHAVTIDLPNTFKIRSQSVGTATTFFNETHNKVLIDLCALYASKLYKLLGDDQAQLMTAINGQWSEAELKEFVANLDYVPNNIAVGALTRTSGDEPISNIVRSINNVIGSSNVQRIHFLGCGGIKKSNSIKRVINSSTVSVDNSTPMNRAIDGSTNGKALSGYFDSLDFKLHRIKPETKDAILKIHENSKFKVYSLSEMDRILSLVIKHQSHESSKETYDARAQLSFHNHSVFAYNAR